MRAVFQHELSSYFTNMTGYVFGAFLLLFVGIYTMNYNLVYGLSNFEYVLNGISFIFLILVPIITMKILAEEKRQKTDQLLYSLPLTMTKVVLGKYVATLVVFLLPALVFSFYPILLSAYGNVELMTSFSSIVGFFFLGAALIAIGIFISSVTESQAVAAGLCFVVMLLNYFITSLASNIPSTAFASFVAFTGMIALLCVIFRNMTRSGPMTLILGVIAEGILILLYLFKGDSFTGLFPEFVESLSLFQNFYGFVDGIFDLTSIVYYLTVIGVFLFLSVQSMEKRRWSE